MLIYLITLVVAAASCGLTVCATHSLRQRRTIKRDIAHQKYINLYRWACGVPVTPILVNAEVGEDGLRLKHDWAFVADLEHDLGYLHTRESEDACRLCSEVKKIEDQRAEYAEKRAKQAELKAVADSGLTWQQQKDEELYKVAVQAMAAYTDSDRELSIKEVVAANSFQELIDKFSNQILKHDGILTPNEARAMREDWTTGTIKAGTITADLITASSVNMFSGYAPAMDRRVERPRDGDYDVVQT